MIEVRVEGFVLRVVLCTISDIRCTFSGTTTRRRGVLYRWTLDPLASEVQAPSRTIRPERAALSSWEVNVEIADSQLPRIVRLALIGAATAFAWIVVSLMLGLGLGQAHADDADGGLLGGALGTVTSVVDSTASTVTDTVSTVSTGVTETVNTVVAVVPEPVQQPVSRVVQSVGTVVTTVTEPVSEVVSGGVVGGIAQPVVDLVTEVPVVGAVVTEVGLDDAVTDLGGTVDETLVDVVDTVGETGETVGGPPAGGTPSLPGIPLLPGLPGFPGGTDDAGADGPATDPVGPSAEGGDSPSAIASTDAVAAATDTIVAVTGSVSRGVWGAASISDSAAVGAVVVSSAPLSTGGPSGTAGGLCLPTASAGPGGAGPGAWALAALLPLAAHRAWVRRAGPEDEHAPPAPSGRTDVSPD